MILDNYEILRRLKRMVTSLEQETSPIYKKQIIRAYPELKEFLCIIYNKNYKFNITGDKVLNYYHSDSYQVDINFSYVIYTLLEDLNKRKISGNFALNQCANFLYEHYEFADMVVRILNKDLKCGINTKTLEDIYKENLGTFGVPLANEYNDALVNFNTEDWFCSRKLDGIRCITVVEEDGHVGCYSREGKKFSTTKKLEEQIKQAFKNCKGIVFDGELCIVDKNGNEDFKGIISKFRRKNYQLIDFIYFVFDSWSLKEFNKSETNTTYFNRYKQLKNNYVENKNIQILEQTLITSQEHFIDLIRILPKHFEGYILRYDDKTLFKRSNNLLKVKKFKSEEYKITKVNKGVKKMEGGHIECCGSLTFIHKGNEVNVGSGLTDYQRIEWFNNPEKILNKVVTIKYQNETKNKKGNLSLRFPVLVCVHGDKREL